MGETADRYWGKVGNRRDRPTQANRGMLAQAR
jgi:hypothetical protein